MRNRAILTFAGICGLIAFFWVIAFPPRALRFRDRQAGRPPPPRAAAHDREGAERAAQALPNDPETLFILATFKGSRGPAEEAWENAARSASTFANSSSPQSPLGMYYLARAREKLGDEGGAKSAYEYAAALYDDRFETDPVVAEWYQAWMRAAWCARRLDRPGQAKAGWERALELIDRTHAKELTAGMAYDRACCLAQLGQAEAAVQSLTWARERGFKDDEWASLDEFLAPIWANEGFMQWLADGTR